MNQNPKTCLWILFYNDFCEYETNDTLVIGVYDSKLKARQALYELLKKLKVKFKRRGGKYVYEGPFSTQDTFYIGKVILNRRIKGILKHLKRISK